MATWTRNARRPTGSRDGPAPLASASFENEHGHRIQIYVMPTYQEYTPAALRPGFQIEWSYKEPGKALMRSDDPFCAWPLELAGELVTLIQEAAAKGTPPTG
jgi:hypothetical protein